jgi:hypothetical protein
MDGAGGSTARRSHTDDVEDLLATQVIGWLGTAILRDAAPGTRSPPPWASICSDATTSGTPG